TEFFGFAADRRFEQTEQADHLVVRSGPVLATECVQGHDRDAARDRVLQYLADGPDAGGVALDLRLVVLASPAPVAVHYYRHVPGKVLGREERVVFERFVRD